jgi:RHH-type proline utilization regulon transcriptional repressor/proline dehydrogenase/delta 1-pyrroline-5-carboxylate dehydrogenase
LRAGEPLIRRGVDLAMELMGEQFVTGQTIDAALKRARKLEAQGFAYSYDMLGEAATTAQDAARYMRDYENALTAIGRASNGRGIYAGPGISIKLSALHPRYSRAQQDRVMAELLPRVKKLAVMARTDDIGLNIDAEEADRLELSLDILEALALDPDLSGWNGLGFVVQAYGKRCPMFLTGSLIWRAALDAASWSVWSRAPIGTARSKRRRSRGWRISPSIRARFTRTCPISPAHVNCWERAMRSSPIRHP